MFSPLIIYILSLFFIRIPFFYVANTKKRGFPDGVSGPELTDLFRQQSIRHGTTIETSTISKINLNSRPFKLWTTEDMEKNNQQPTAFAHSVIIATGATAKRAGILGEDEYWNKGISGCAVCDGGLPLFRNKILAVIGGGVSKHILFFFLSFFHFYLFIYLILSF